MIRSSQIMPNESIFMMMTSSMTSQGGLKIDPLHSFINVIITFFMITKQRATQKSNAQNVGNAHGYLSGLFNFRYNFRPKSLSRAQNNGHFENFEILNTASIWPRIWKDRPKLCQKKYFHDDDVIDDVTGWPQSRPSIFLYIWNNNIFHHN